MIKMVSAAADIARVFLTASCIQLQELAPVGQFQASIEFFICLRLSRQSNDWCELECKANSSILLSTMTRLCIGDKKNERGQDDNT